MFSQIASHGFIVTAGQMYPTLDFGQGYPTMAEEQETAMNYLNWATANLETAVGVWFQILEHVVFSLEIILWFDHPGCAVAG
jgi:hypothetical protein